MELLRTPDALQAWRQRQRAPLHFVPTMGALHRGHQELIRTAAQPREAGEPAVLVSVFVNPLQFGPGEDLERYPRDLEADLALARDAGAAALFAPTADDLFPGGVRAISRVLAPALLQESLCGPGRPGHFDGVATVVVRLLALVHPHRLLLGEKDWQQLVILRQVVRDLGLPVVVEGVATVRESDGLPASSRNRYLSAEDRRQAAALPRALQRVCLQLQQQGASLAQGAPAALGAQLREAGLAVEYAELVQAGTLAPTDGLSGLGLLAAAVRCGSARLIDHFFVMPRAPIVAIDGPAGAGKSTVTRAFAARLGLVYLDTGAMYRAVTWWIQRVGADPADPLAVAAQLEGLEIRFGGGETGQRVLLGGEDITEAIRSPAVTEQVSVVAAHACVREALTAQQQAMGERGGLVAEGRDIGTAVFPDADLKVFLTATAAERARRRALDLRDRGFPVPPLEELEAQIAERDHRDASRAVAPLCMADDAVELVTDGLAIEAVIQRLVDLFRARVPHDAWPDPEAGGVPA